MTDEEVAAYSQAVWDEFTRRTGRPERIMSPLEWEVVRAWRLEGIRLRVVLRGMADTKARALRLEYYDPSVREAHRRWQRALGGVA